MTPAELAAAYGNDPRFKAYIQWAAEGAKHPVWAFSAEDAARQAGIARFAGIEDAYVDDPSRYTMANDPLKWGEQKKFNVQTGAEISRNPAWVKFVQDWTQAHPDAGNLVQTAPAAPAARALNLGPEAAAASGGPAGDPILAALGSRPAARPAAPKLPPGVASRSMPLAAPMRPAGVTQPLTAKKKPLAPWEKALFGRR